MIYDLQALVEAYNRPWREFRQAVGSRFTTLNRYKVEGMPIEVADRLAIRCELHPIEVWGMDAWIKGLTERESQ